VQVIIPGRKRGQGGKADWDEVHGLKQGTGSRDKVKHIERNVTRMMHVDDH